MIDNLTIIIVTYLTKLDIIQNCLNSINKNINIKIIENSEKFEFNDEIKSNFKNVEIFCTGKNLGYGGGNNYGLNLVDTEYALILNPDLTCGEDFFLNLKNNLINIEKFTLLGCQYLNDVDTVPAGFFEKFKNTDFIKRYKNKDIELIEKVEWIKGFAVLINMKDFEDKKIFDENYFLFNEEIDLCKSVINRDGNIFTCSNLKLKHLGFKSSTGRNEKEIISLNRVREWHWMWSSFYFYKKNYGLTVALKTMFGKFIKSFFKMLFYFITFQKEKREKYQYRFLGILSSMLGKASSFRDK